jgi:tRNA pseudouridine55 synthase
VIALKDVPLLTARTLPLRSLPVDPAEGAVILIDKPKGWTSFDVVAKLRGILRIRKIGHAGTLDPMATGLLLVCVGRATKLVDTLQAGEKEYAGTIRFGATTPTDDAESEEDQRFPVDHLTEEIIRTAADGFIGDSLQTPPAFSARKVDGVRMYKLARKGEKVEVAPRAVTIRAFDIERYALPEIDFRIVCTKGTYIRSIARDLGARVGSGAYLTALRRTRSGDYNVDDAVTIEQLQMLRKQEEGSEK